jgi:cell division cycle protein 20 (cofactor of APC complex)
MMSLIARARITSDLERIDLSECYDENVIRDEIYKDKIFKVCFGKDRPEKHHSILRGEYGSKRDAEMQKLLARARPTTASATRVLQAQGISDDFYANTLDISKDKVIAIALEKDLLIKASSGETACVSFDDRAIPSSVRWFSEGSQIFTGFSDSHMALVDAATAKPTYKENSFRSWMSVATTASSAFIGSTKGLVMHMDVRSPKIKDDIGGHVSSVCGLALHPKGTMLASGGNDDIVKIWDLRVPTVPCAEFHCHKSAIKALSWASWDDDLLFSGGGMHDKTICVLSIKKQAPIATTAPISQVTGLHASKTEAELISCHGYGQNSAVIWKFVGEKQRFIQLTKLEGHTERLLHSALSPDNTQLVTASADETIRIWDVFEKMKKLKISDEPFADTTNAVLR